MKIKECLLIILLLFSPLFGCQPPVSGTPVWDIAADNVLLTNTIESILDGIDIDFVASFTVLNQLIELTSTVESKAQVLLGDLNQLQSQVQDDVVTVQVIESTSLHIANIPLFDFTGVFTSLDVLEQDIISQMDLLNTDLQGLSDNIAQLIDTQLMHDATIASQLGQVQDDVIQLRSVLQNIDFTQQFDLSNSIVDLIALDVDMLSNDIAQLHTQLIVGFQGTFTALEANLELAQPFNSLIEIIPISVVDTISGVYDALNELEVTINTISSQVDAVNADIAAINSAVDLLGSSADQISSQFDNVENSLAHVESILANLVPMDKLSLIEGLITELKTGNSLLDYMIDESLCMLSATISSKLSVVDIDIVDQNSSLELLSNNLVSVESMINSVITDDVSRLHIINSNIDIQLQEITAIESTVDIINQNIDYIIDSTLINNVVHNMQAMSSLFDLMSSDLPTISSQLDELDEQLFTIDSLVDAITPQTQTEFSYAIDFESRLASITLDDVIVSAPPGIEDRLESIESKLDTYTSLVPVLETLAQELVNDMQETWTVLNVIQTSLDNSINTLSSASALLQTDIAKSLSVSGVFTVIDSIIAQENVVNTKVDTYTSLVNALNADLSTDFNGIFTALIPLTQNQSANNTATAQITSLLGNISSELTTVQNSLGIPIYGRQLPLTITTPGRYYLAENINYGGATTAITINTNNVTIDLNGRILNYTATGTVTGILINNVDNTKIINGTVRGFTNIATGAGTTTNVIINNVTIARSAINFAGSGRNHKIYNLVLSQLKSVSPFTDSISIVQHTNMDIRDCMLFNHAGIETRGNATNVVVQRCLFENVNANGAFGFNGTINNFVTKSNLVTGTGQGWAARGVLTGCNILDSYFIATTDIALFLGGINAVLKNNNIINCLIGMATLASFTNNYVAFNTLIQNTSGNISLSGANTYLGNFAFNTNAIGSPAPTNYSVPGSNITGKFRTASQRGSFIGVPTYWHNINMLP